jgi:hypothetical protein
VKSDHDKHLDRWSAAKEAFKAATGREIEAYALVAVDSAGEVYYGANFTHNRNHQKAILNRLSAMSGDARTLIAKGDHE